MSTPGLGPRIDFETLEMKEEEIRAATIPEMLRLLPGGDEKPRTLEEIALDHERRFIRGWEKLACRHTLVAGIATDYTVRFGIAPDEDVALALLDNTLDRSPPYDGRKREFKGLSRLEAFCCVASYILEAARIKSEPGYKMVKKNLP